MTFAIRQEITGLDPLLRKLEGLKQNAAKKVMRKAVTAGSKILNKGMKARAPAGKRKLLRKAIGQRVEVYRSGNVVAIVGPRKGMRIVVDGKPVDAVRYAHIVERGRKAVVVRKKMVLSDGTIIFGRRVKAALPNPFMRRALDELEGQIFGAIAAEAAAGIEREAAA